MLEASAWLEFPRNTLKKTFKIHGKYGVRTLNQQDAVATSHLEYIP
jgi:hypothetical protein